MKTLDIVKFLQDSNLVVKHNISKNSVIKGISDDSRNIQEGFVFIAIQGLRADGFKFVDDAIKKGSTLIVSESPFFPKGINSVQVKNARQALSLVASFWYGNPSRKLKIIGVTGTKGKTTVVHLIFHIMQKLGFKVGMISTVKAKMNNEEMDTGLHVTNPEPLLLQSLLRKMVDKNLEYVVMEVTSHGMDQERVYGINFDIGVMTNIAPEHLDYHKTFANYRNAKLKLFTNAKSVVLNRDDPSYKYISGCVGNKKIALSYSQKDIADIFAKAIRISGNLMEYELKCGTIKTKGKINLPGEYNLYNILAAVSTLKVLNIKPNQSINALEDFSAPEGRLEKVKNKAGLEIYIDFAHTPDSLENLLQLLKSMTKGKLVCVFGCAGERDKKKRFKMGEISGKLADVTVITAEDPRSENVLDISKQIKRGAVRSGAIPYTGKYGNRHRYLIIPDRSEAIYYSINNIVQKNDTLVVCGKGHEKSMCYGSIEHPWSDHQCMKDCLSSGTGRSAILMGAGKGKRLNSELPKVINKIAEKPMLSYTINNLRKAGFSDIKVVVGYEAKKVVGEIGPTVEYVYQRKRLGTGHAAWQGIKKLANLDNPVLVVNGDDSAFYNPKTLSEIYEFHYKNKTDLTITSSILEDPTGIGRLVRDNNGNLLKIVEEKVATEEEKEIKESNIGLYVFNPEWFLQNIKKVKKAIVGEYYIGDLVEVALKQKAKVCVYQLKNVNEWCGVNTQEQLEFADEKMKERLFSDK